MRFLERSTEIFLIACVAAIIVVVFGQVVMRYGLQDVPPWTEELARMIFTWIIFVGAAVAYRRKAHIVIDLVVSRLSGTSRRVVDTVILIAIAVFLGFALVQGIHSMWLARDDLSPVMRMSMTLLLLPLPAGTAIMLIYVLADLWRNLVPVRG
jgi:TRAP-type C4-dicarboxylate transport system permease small subunit